MRYPYEFLKSFVEIKKTPEELAQDLSNFGFNLEHLEKVNSETILDLEVNPNRGDCLSMLGLAREIAAFEGEKVILPKAEVKEHELSQKIKVEVERPEICPRYTARIIDQIEIKPSPEWLQERLEAYGFRPINNIVDVTNYVMIAVGQPLHAFDYGKINEGLMKIRLARSGEELMTLDGKNRKLPEEAIVIDDGEKIFDLAGIMGGFSSEVDAKTTTVVLQGAIFDPVIIRRAAKKMSHTTDASYRYERGVDYQGTISAVDLAAALIQETSRKAQVGKLIDHYFKDFEPRKIILEPAKANELLGLDIPTAEMKNLLGRLGFESAGEEELEVTVPSYRHADIKIWQDLAEEIARLKGYQKIPEASLKGAEAEENADWAKRQALKDVFMRNGFTEIISSPFLKADQIKQFKIKLEDCREITNFLFEEMRYLRPTLKPSLLMAISRNPWAPDISLFEIGKVFRSGQESFECVVAVVGKSDRQLKTLAESLSLQIEITPISPDILQIYKIRRPVMMATFPLEDIKTDENYKEDFTAHKYRPISKYAPTVRDLAFVVQKNDKAEVIAETIKKVSPKIFTVELFDEFESEKLGKDVKNLAFHLWLESLNGPVAEVEANEILQKVIINIENTYGAKLRSK